MEPTQAPEPSLASLFALLNQVASNQSQIQNQMNQLAASHDTTNTRIDALKAEASAAQSALQSFLQSSLSSVESSITHKHRQLSLQILQLQNPTKKHYTRFTSLPSEIVALVLSWVYPKDVWKLRRLSRSFRNSISTKSFALLNIRRFVPAPDLKNHESSEPSATDIVYLSAPLSYQTVYIQKQLNHLKSFRWGVNDAEDFVHHELDLNSSIPPALLQSKILVRLALVDCNLTGTIPVEIANLKSLQQLDLDTNALCGSIPDVLAELNNLTVLVLSNNKLSGPLPSALGQLQKLESLYIKNNSLSGPIPIELTTLLNLKFLNLFGNKTLEASLPSEFGNLTLLMDLGLAGCNFSGPIPHELGQLSRLESLYLAGNDLLEGEVPESLGRLDGLRECDLRGCRRLHVGFEFPERVEVLGPDVPWSLDEGE
ncbi:hypothetical protein HDU98_007284 [Podochytrium sp. JEL0797]|nr:hypothetical protein HDU98_007284 [Podochytrium sp. JEL0797]